MFDRGRDGSFRARRCFAFTLPLGLALALAACSSDSALPNFDLSPAYVSTRHPLQADLVVSEPFGPLVLDTKRILVRSGPETLAYLTDGEWSDRLPALIQARLVETLKNADLMPAGPRGDAAPDYALELEIRHFELDASSRQGVVEIAAKIVRARDGRIVAERVFKDAAPSGGTSGAEATAALNKALSEVMAQIAAFVAVRV
jgi:cholesterol transport system auxiliary component